MKSQVFCEDCNKPLSVGEVFLSPKEKLKCYAHNEDLEENKEETFFITPTNEGQELNYTETFKGLLCNAITRCEYMKERLKEILSYGEINVILTNEEGKEIVYNENN